MKKYLITVAGLLTFCMGAYAQREKAKFPEYTFTTVKANPITSVKDQHRSGTCWAFSTIGFIESEVIRINGIKDSLKYPDFSEMYVVSKSYQDRADKYIRLDGNLTFSAGSEADDVLDIARDYGLVPQEAMPGLNYGTDKPVHGELDAVARAYVSAINKNPNRTLSTAWKKGFTAIMDAYLGPCPEKFTVNGKEYTPATYRDALKFNPDDYVTLTSFTHHPFYTRFALEICDNWRWDKAYNIPIEELIQVLDDALDKGYTAAWGTDVSEYGFTRDGLAILAKKDDSTTKGSDQAKWTGSATEKDKEADKKEVEEIVPDQEYRQKGFDNRSITDDHGMQIFGTATDQNGKKFYMVKNSWGKTGRYNGIWYASEAFVKGQTIDIVLHRSAIPASLRKKLGIK